MRVLICGGRNVGRVSKSTGFQNAGHELEAASAARLFISDMLSKLHAEQPFTLVICGAEGGAERLGKKWAELANIPVQPFMMDQRQTISDRNKRMLDQGKPEFIIAFEGGEETEIMLANAEQRGIPVARIPIPVFHPPTKK